jgi:PD-(D/E)XK nuclease superfamily protein
MVTEPSQAELEDAHCWEPGDRAPGRPAMTAFRRAARLHHARWRDARGLPIGTQPLVPQPNTPSRLVGSRLPVEYARETGANFVTAAALDAARARLAQREPQQSIDHSRTWADLLWSTSLAFNLFGDLAADLARADRAVHTWWPDTPGTVCDVLFEHSPGRLDLAYTGSLMAFAVAFVLDLGDGTLGVIGVEVRYHELAKREVPKPKRVAHYREIADRSGVFTANADAVVNGTALTVTWLVHLLVLSMLQHPNGEVRWGRFAVVYPAANTDWADLVARYASVVADASSFASLTIEDVLRSGVLPRSSARALRDRYVVR